LNSAVFAISQIDYGYCKKPSCH